jgi:hypothetical protein
MSDQEDGMGSNGYIRPRDGGGRDMWLRVSDIAIDPAYQKALSEPQLKRMGVSWRPELAGAIEVSHRADDRLVALDGQHRLVFARRLGVEFIRAIVHEGLTTQQEAMRFVLLNTVRSAPKSVDIFNARLVSGDPEAEAVRDEVVKAGFFFPRHSGEKPYPAILATDICCRAFRAGGRVLLADTLTVIGQAWPQDRRSTTAPILSGVAATLYYYGRHPNFLRRTLIERLARVPALRIFQRGLELGSQPGGPAIFAYSGHRSAVVEIYNRGAQRTLPALTIPNAKAISAGLNPWAVA